VNWKNPLDKLIMSELEFLSENLNLIIEVGIAFGIYDRPAVPEQKSATQEEDDDLTGFDGHVEALVSHVDEDESLVAMKRYVLVVSLP
jgi:hypothetical protein